MCVVLFWIVPKKNSSLCIFQSSIAIKSPNCRVARHSAAAFYRQRRGGGVIVVKPRPGVYAIGYRSVSAQNKKRSGLTAIDTGWHSAVRLRAHFFFNNRLNTLVDPLLLLSRNVAWSPEDVIQSSRVGFSDRSQPLWYARLGTSVFYAVRTSTSGSYFRPRELTPPLGGPRPMIWGHYR